MNNNRRKELKKVKNEINRLINYLNYIKDDEEDAMQNMPENLQDTDIHLSQTKALPLQHSLSESSPE